MSEIWDITFLTQFRLLFTQLDGARLLMAAVLCRLFGCFTGLMDCFIKYIRELEYEKIESGNGRYVVVWACYW